MLRPSSASIKSGKPENGSPAINFVSRRNMALLKKCVFVLLLILPALAEAQRLPQDVVPDLYDLTFSPDLAQATFTGEETIQVRLLKPSAAITLNAAELQIQEATVLQGENPQTAQVTFHPESQQVTLALPARIPAGPASIHIRFTGILNDKLRGFYLAKTRLRNYAITQFESTDARRAFPCFDEPAFKATFDITLIVDKSDTTISNGELMADVSGPGADKHTMKFRTTARMSTYLVAMAVGDFTCSEGSADNIPIRVCGTPDKKRLHAAALRYAQEILKYYNQYYGIPYPFKKLDIVGAPDFEAGAMENTAAIFYRESDLFIDDDNSSVPSHQIVFEILAHEMAHQWFGDLVTMKWWDNVWLNEGFATWMALKPSQALHPEWNAVLDAVGETNRALAVDSLANTHPIRAQADTPDEINELFDTISYEKGAAVLRMVEAYVSPDVFRRGVNAYLHKFAYSNATAEDFWAALTQASGRPVDKIMPTFVNQAGEPLLSVKTSCVTPPPATVQTGKRRRSRRVVKPHPKTEITVSQHRFFANPAAAASVNLKTDGLWMVPVCVKADGAKPFCQIFSQPTQTVPVAECSPWVFLNANASGYYRTRYEAAALQKLSSIAATELTPAERISLIHDEAALVTSGQESVSRYLDLVAAVNQDSERAVIESYTPTLVNIYNHVLADSDKPAFRAWIRANFTPMFAKVGWTPAVGEAAETREVRALLIVLLGELGADPQVMRRSVELARQYLKDPHAMDPTIAQTVLLVSARSNDPELFNGYLAAMSDPNSTPEVVDNVSIALSWFNDPELVSRWLQVIVSPQTRNQNAAGYLGAVMRNVETQKLVWNWTKDHWAGVADKLTMSSGAGVVLATGSFCDASMRDDVQAFFADHKVASSERALKQAIERINSCISLRDHQQHDLSAWLTQHPGTTTGSR
jgi:aminopeptidase N/puromycin-sensitive aminopeptidase